MALVRERDAARRRSQQHLRVGAVDEVRDLTRTGPGADADADEPGLLAPEHDRVHVGPVRDLDGDPVAPLMGPECAREAGGALVILAPRHRVTRDALDERDAIGVRGRIARHHPGDRFLLRHRAGDYAP